MEHFYLNHFLYALGINVSVKIEVTTTLTTLTMPKTFRNLQPYLKMAGIDRRFSQYFSRLGIQIKLTKNIGIELLVLIPKCS